MWWMWHNYVFVVRSATCDFAFERTHKDYFVKNKTLALFKLITSTTNGAPVMLGHTCIVQPSEYFPDKCINYQLIIHKHVFCGSFCKLWKKWWMLLWRRSPQAKSLQRRLFRAQLEWTDAEHRGLTSRDTFMARLMELGPENKYFLKLSKENKHRRMSRVLFGISIRQRYHWNAKWFISRAPGSGKMWLTWHMQHLAIKGNSVTYLWNKKYPILRRWAF